MRYNKKVRQSDPRKRWKHHSTKCVARCQNFVSQGQVQCEGQLDHTYMHYAHIRVLGETEPQIVKWS